MPRVNNNGVQIHYQVSGQGEPLVLIHGWSCEGRYWDEFGYVSTLSNAFTVIVPDLRAHGSSDVPGDKDFSDRAFASDIIAVLDDVGAASAHVFGYSLGGWVVFELIASNTSRMRTTIVGGAHPYAEDTSAIRRVTPFDLVSMWNASAAPLSEDSKTRILASDPQLLAEMIPDRADKAERLDKLPVRCLMICGTDDWRFDGMRRFAERADGCRFEPFDGADHMQAWVQSARILPVVQDFLQAATT
jgi:pimeloyl-ACP methyl ester carboxylesterase